MPYSTRRASRNHYDGSSERNGYNHKKFDIEENMVNDPLAKSFAIRESLHLGYDEIIVFVSKDQISHELWPQAEKLLKQDGVKIEVQEENNQNGYFDLIRIEDGIEEKIDVGRRHDWENHSGVTYQTLDDGHKSKVNIDYRWMACLGTDYFPFDRPNFFFRKWNKPQAKVHPDLVIEYSHDGSRSYRIGYEQGKKYAMVVQSKRNNREDASIQPLLSDVTFMKWVDDVLYDYKPTVLPEEVRHRYARDQFNARTGEHRQLSRSK